MHTYNNYFCELENQFQCCLGRAIETGGKQKEGRMPSYRDRQEAKGREDAELYYRDRREAKGREDAEL